MNGHSEPLVQGVSALSLPISALVPWRRTAPRLLRRRVCITRLKLYNGKPLRKAVIKECRRTFSKFEVKIRRKRSHFEYHQRMVSRQRCLWNSRHSGVRPVSFSRLTRACESLVHSLHQSLERLELPGLRIERIRASILFRNGYFRHYKMKDESRLLEALPKTAPLIESSRFIQGRLHVIQLWSVLMPQASIPPDFAANLNSVRCSKCKNNWRNERRNRVLGIQNDHWSRVCRIFKDCEGFTWAGLWLVCCGVVPLSELDGKRRRKRWKFLEPPSEFELLNYFKVHNLILSPNKFLPQTKKYLLLLSCAVNPQSFYDFTNRIKVSNFNYYIFSPSPSLCCLKLCLKDSASPKELQQPTFFAFNNLNSPSRYLNRPRSCSCASQSLHTASCASHLTYTTPPHVC